MCLAPAPPFDIAMTGAAVARSVSTDSEVIAGVRVTFRAVGLGGFPPLALMPLPSEAVTPPVQVASSAPTPPCGRDFRVLRGERVTLVALSLPRLLPCRAAPARGVHLVSNWFKVARVHTVPDSTEVVDDEVIGDRPGEHFVCRSVPVPSRPINRELAVPIRRQVPLPLPAQRPNVHCKAAVEAFDIGRPRLGEGFRRQ